MKIRNEGICVYDFDNSISINNDSFNKLNIKKKLIPKTIRCEKMSIIKSFSNKQNISRIPLFAIKSNLTNRISPKNKEKLKNSIKSERKDQQFNNEKLSYIKKNLSNGKKFDNKRSLQRSQDIINLVKSDLAQVFTNIKKIEKVFSRKVF